MRISRRTAIFVAVVMIFYIPVCGAQGRGAGSSRQRRGKSSGGVIGALDQLNVSMEKNEQKKEKKQVSIKAEEKSEDKNDKTSLRGVLENPAYEHFLEVRLWEMRPATGPGKVMKRKKRNSLTL